MRNELQYNLFVKTTPRRLFFRASIPGAIGMLASALYQIFDGIFVGNILGSTSFAAVNLAMPFVIINFALSDLIGVGSSVPISIALGEGKKEFADKIFTLSCLLIVTLGVLTGALLYLLAPVFISLMGASGTFAEEAITYLRTYALFSPITTMVFATDNYLRISGKIRRSMFLNIFMSLFCGLAEFVFLFFFGFGVEGAAIGSCLGMSLAVLFSIIPFFRGKLALTFVRPTFSFQIIRKIISCGLPSFLNNIAGRLTSIIINLMLVRFGGEAAVSIYGVLMYTDGMVLPIMYGSCDSLQPAIGYNWGAGLYSRVRKIEKYCFMTAFVLCMIAFFCCFFFPSMILSLFVAEAPPYGELAIVIFSFTYITRWLSFATQSFMLAIEKAVLASVISISMAFIFPVSLLFLLNGLGLFGVWMNMPLTALLGALLSITILLKEKKNLIKKDNPVDVSVEY